MKGKKHRSHLHLDDDMTEEEQEVYLGPSVRGYLVQNRHFGTQPK